MTARIEGLQKMLDTCSPKMKALYQRAIEEERAKQAEDDRVKAELFAQRKQIAEKMDDSAFALGEELFGQDYDIEFLLGTWRVTSHVALEHHAGEYTFNTEPEANSKRRWLILQRLYDKYVRSGEVASIAALSPNS